MKSINLFKCFAYWKIVLEELDKLKVNLFVVHCQYEGYHQNSQQNF